MQIDLNWKLWRQIYIQKIKVAAQKSHFHDFYVKIYVKIYFKIYVKIYVEIYVEKFYEIFGGGNFGEKIMLKIFLSPFSF